MQFDAKRFLTTEFGNAQSVVGMFSQAGVEGPTLSAVEKWFQRGIIAGKWFPLVVIMVEMRQGECRLSRYLTLGGV